MTVLCLPFAAVVQRRVMTGAVGTLGQKSIITTMKIKSCCVTSILLPFRFYTIPVKCYIKDMLSGIHILFQLLTCTYQHYHLMVFVSVS